MLVLIYSLRACHARVLTAHDVTRNVLLEHSSRNVNCLFKVHASENFRLNLRHFLEEFNSLYVTQGCNEIHTATVDV